MQVLSGDFQALHVAKVPKQAMPTTLQLLAKHCSSTHLLDDEVELGLNWLAYQGARPTLASQSTLFQLTVSQSSCTKPLVSPELAFHAHQNTLLMALCSPSAPLPATQLLSVQHTLICLIDCPLSEAMLCVAASKYAALYEQSKQATPNHALCLSSNIRASCTQAVLLMSKNLDNRSHSHRQNRTPDLTPSKDVTPMDCNAVLISISN